jgi:transcriptional regulator with XRE-family HTH domain
MIHALQTERRDDIRSFLKALRGRLHPDTKTLGAHERLNSRRGRAVTQEELAEAVGVTRGWYALLESGAAIQPSVAMLDRLAAALKTTPDERTTLFHLAIPALQNSVAENKQDMYDVLSFLKAVSSRLWKATSENEALTIVGEHLANWFQGAGLVVLAKRVDVGEWELCFAPDRVAEKPWSKYFEDLQAPGDVSDDAALMGVAPDVCRLAAETLRRYHLESPSFIQGRISSRHGFVGCIHVQHETRRIYSDLDRAVLGAAAELTSLALS